ncbi:hypothetical protein GCM10009554_20370 [Kribbella koreensis]|uniref:Uncharacterized protein n=1 Tax=Kribbella koreensis TaxID=57909 RepID=A0ABP4AE30_9ACTN
MDSEVGGLITYTSGWFPAWRYLAQLPQGRKAARVSELFRVRGESLCPDPFAVTAKGREIGWDRTIHAYEGVR